MIRWINIKDRLPDVHKEGDKGTYEYYTSKPVLVEVSGIIVTAQYQYDFDEEGLKNEIWFDCWCKDVINNDIKYWAEYNLPE